MPVTIEDLFVIRPEKVTNLICRLSIGQRATDTREKLVQFLHDAIFSEFYPLHAEMYFPARDAGQLLPLEHVIPPMKQLDVPSGIVISLSAQNSSFCKTCEIDLSKTCDIYFTHCPGNSLHLLTPIIDKDSLLAVIYWGGNNRYTVSPNFFSTLDTLGAVIGSRLKSLDTIWQLKESLHALEYSEKLRTALYEISEETHHTEDITILYANLHQIVGRLINAENFQIALLETKNEGDFLTVVYGVDNQNPPTLNQSTLITTENNTIISYLVSKKQALLLTSDSLLELCQQNNLVKLDLNPKSWLGAPFYFDGLAGAVCVQSYSDVVYSEKDRDFLAFVARHLADALKKRTAVEDLQKAKDRAEQAEKNKSTFLANMSHEIRTPMNGILGLTELVLKSDISSQQRTYLEMVHASADRLLKIINDILDFSKIEAGKLELNPSHFSLRNTLADALEPLAIIAAKKNIHLKIDCAKNIPDKLIGDPDKLQQIIVNLVGNAIKFTQKGGVTITLQKLGARSYINDVVELHFQVKDTGIGIPEDKIHTVFEAFNQIGTTRDSNQPGTGLGLVIAAQLVELMGGEIHIDSQPGKGSTFHFSIRFALAPGEIRSDSSPLQTNPMKTAPRETLKELSILLVEDEFINQTLAVTVLEKEGCQVDVAENGLNALKKYSNRHYDLILMDIQMPELNGFETTEHIRRQEHSTGKHIPIIAMTAYAVKGDREKCLAAGMDGYISKPIRPDRLREEIEAVLSHTNNQQHIK